MTTTRIDCFPQLAGTSSASVRREQLFGRGSAMMARSLARSSYLISIGASARDKDGAGAGEL